MEHRDLQQELAGLDTMMTIFVSFITGNLGNRGANHTACRSVNREPHPPSKLFQSASSLTISGCASHHILDRLLEKSKCHRITHLVLNNVFAFAQPKITPTKRIEEERNEPWTYVIPARERSTPFDNEFGPIQGHLILSAPSMTALSSLHIHTIGIARGCLSSIPEADISRYKEYGNVLKTLTETLETFVFEQGMDSKEWTTQDGYHFCATRIAPLDWSRRPMDVLFADYLLPSIMSARWYKLRTLALRGIGGLGSGFVDRLDCTAEVPAYYRNGSLADLEADLRERLDPSARLILEKSTLEPLDSGEEFSGDGLENLLEQ